MRTLVLVLLISGCATTHNLQCYEVTADRGSITITPVTADGISQGTAIKYCGYRCGEWDFEKGQFVGSRQWNEQGELISASRENPMTLEMEFFDYRNELPTHEIQPELSLQQSDQSCTN